MLDTIYDWITNPFGLSTQAVPFDGTSLFGDDTQEVCYNKIITLMEQNKAANLEQTPMLYYVDTFASATNVSKHVGKIYSGRNKEEVLLAADKNDFIKDEIVNFVEMCDKLFDNTERMTYQDFVTYMCTKAFDEGWYEHDTRPKFTLCTVA
jgi:hypothetical protein